MLYCISSLSGTINLFQPIDQIFVAPAVQVKGEASAIAGLQSAGVELNDVAWSLNNILKSGCATFGCFWHLVNWRRVAQGCCMPWLRFWRRRGQTWKIDSSDSVERIRCAVAKGNKHIFGNFSAVLSLSSGWAVVPTHSSAALDFPMLYFPPMLDGGWSEISWSGASPATHQKREESEPFGKTKKANKQQGEPKPSPANQTEATKAPKRPTRNKTENADQNLTHQKGTRRVWNAKEGFRTHK